MWGKRVAGTAAVFLCLSWLLLHLREAEAAVFCGLPVASEGQLKEQDSEKTFVEQPDVGGLLYFEGNRIPYDVGTDRFYLPQDVTKEAFDGRFSPAKKDVCAYWIQDDDIASMRKGVQEGHAYRIWLSAGSSAAAAEVVFTGLPVVSLTSETAIGDSYGKGELDVWSPHDEDLGVVMDRHSYVLCKESVSKETFTVKLRKADYEENNKVSLLDMGKHDAWKLYRVKEEDTTLLRMMLAFCLWDEISQEEGLKAPCQFVELLVNGQYQGLFILRPRTDDDYLALDATEEEAWILDTDDLARQEVPRDLYTRYAPTNMIDYGSYLQATYAYPNIFEDLSILQRKKGEVYLLPGKAEHVFGLFPGRYQYLSYQSSERVITAEDLALAGGAGETAFEQAMAEAWERLRGGCLGDEQIAALVEALALQLRESGVVARLGLTAALSEDKLAELGEEAAYRDTYGYNVQMLLSQIKERYAFVDAYYQEWRQEQ